MVMPELQRNVSRVLSYDRQIDQATAGSLRGARGGNDRVIVTVQGLGELTLKFAAMPPKLQLKLERKALRPITQQVIARKAKMYAPKATGALAKSIKTRAMSHKAKRVNNMHRSDPGLVARSGSSDSLFRGETFYGGFQEFGTKRGIEAKHFFKRAYDEAPPMAYHLHKKALAEFIREEAQASYVPKRLRFSRGQYVFTRPKPRLRRTPLTP